MSDTALERDVRELRGNFSALTIAVTQATAAVQSLDKRLTDVEPTVKNLATTLAEHKGSWKVITALAGASSVIGGLVVELAKHLK